MLKVSDQGGSSNFEKAPQGNHIATCYLVVDMGEQDSTFQGVTSKKNKIRVSWELHGPQMEDGRPFSVSKTYTASLNEKAALRKDLEGWRGRAFTQEELAGFDVFNELGHSCMVNVIHNTADNGNVYVNVMTVASLPTGMKAPPLVNPLTKFSIGGSTQAEFDALPDWLRGKINKPGAESYQAPQPDTAPPQHEPQQADDNPFSDDEIMF